MMHSPLIRHLSKNKSHAIAVCFLGSLSLAVLAVIASLQSGLHSLQASTLRHYAPAYDARAQMRLERRLYREEMEKYEYGLIDEKPVLEEVKQEDSISKSQSASEQNSVLTDRQRAIVERYANSVGSCPSALKSRGLYVACLQLLNEKEEDVSHGIRGFLNSKAYWAKQRIIEPVSIKARLRQLEEARDSSNRRPDTDRYSVRRGAGTTSANEE